MESQIHFKGSSAYWKSRKLGTIYPGESTFQSVKRTPKNIFKMFNGLGLNKEMLNLLFRMGIRFIEVPFCSQILKTTITKWLRKGIPLPQQYCSEKVDEQLILPMKALNLDEDIPINTLAGNEQLSLFGSA